jgi:light-regulated signal transduction histidine kinase (bacteriophytochrome)
MAAILAFDLLMPLGIALGLLYTICIFLVVKESRRRIVMVTVLASFCTILKYIVHYNEQTEYFFLVNRLITILTLGITAVVAIRYRLLQDRQKLINEIERKNKEAEQFIYIVSHDLNEPIRTVKSMVQLLEKRNADQLDDDGKKFLHFINNSTERMQSLLLSLLDYGRLGRNSVMKKTDCNVVVAEVLEDLSQLLDETGSRVIADKLPVITAYPSELRLLFQNLIANAAKFRKEGIPPEIRIQSQETPEGAWLFSVADNGIGINKANSDKIFTIFKKLHAREEYEGTGIGLAHCRKIVEMHHGKIWVKSKPGIGSTFYFTIPTN